MTEYLGISLREKISQARLPLNVQRSLYMLRNLIKTALELTLHHPGNQLLGYAGKNVLDTMANDTIA